MIVKRLRIENIMYIYRKEKNKPNTLCYYRRDDARLRCDLFVKKKKINGRIKHDKYYAQQCSAYD